MNEDESETTPGEHLATAMANRGKQVLIHYTNDLICVRGKKSQALLEEMERYIGPTHGLTSIVCISSAKELFDFWWVRR